MKEELDKVWTTMVVLSMAILIAVALGALSYINVTARLTAIESRPLQPLYLIQPWVTPVTTSTPGE